MEKLANNNRAPRTPIAYWLVLALPVIVHFALLWRYTVNAPRLDEFSDALVFLPHFLDANTFAERIKIFFTPYNEHRYGITHSLYWLCSVLLDGPLNFRWLTITGNIFLAGLLVLLCRSVRHSPHAAVLWVITGLLLFNLQAWSGMFWTAGSMAQYAVVMFAFWSFMLVTRDTMSSLLLAVMSASLATLSQGNGIFVWPIVGIYLWYSTGSLRHTRCLLWLLCSSIAIILYFFDFIFFSREGSAPAQATLLTALPSPMQLVEHMLVGVLVLPGSWLLYPDATTNKISMALAITVGAVLWITLAVLLAKKCLWKKPVLLMWLVFIAGSILSITLIRTLTAGISQAFQGHYKIYTTLLLWLVIATLHEYAARNNQHQAQRVAYGSLLLAVVLYVVALIKFMPVMQDNMQALADDTHRWLYTHNLQRAETLYYVPRYNEKLDYAVENRAYDPWTLATESEKIVASIAMPTCNSASMTAVNTLQVRGQPKGLALRVFGVIDSAGINDSLTLLLCSSEGNISAQLDARNLQNSVVGKYNVDVLVPRNNIPSREWNVFMCTDCAANAH